MTLQEFLEIVLPLLFDESLDRVEKNVEGIGHVKAYRVVDIVRIDINPLGQNE